MNGFQSGNGSRDSPAHPDDLARRPVFAGATLEASVTEMFFGERYGRVVDLDDHRWALAIKREQFTPDDIDARTPRAL